MQPASQSGEAYCSSCALWMQMHVGCVVGFALSCPFLERMSNACRIVACRERERRAIDLNCPLSSAIVSRHPKMCALSVTGGLFICSPKA